MSATLQSWSIILPLYTDTTLHSMYCNVCINNLFIHLTWEKAFHWLSIYLFLYMYGFIGLFLSDQYIVLWHNGPLSGSHSILEDYVSMSMYFLGVSHRLWSCQEIQRQQNEAAHCIQRGQKSNRYSPLR